MIVIADSSPLNYLILIDTVEVLPALFGEVLIPEAVVRELQSVGAPAEVTAWISRMPTWLRIEKSVPFADEGLNKLDEGEREAIALAYTHRDNVLLLIDETKGRAEAARLHIRVMGLVGILDRAAEKRLIDLPAVVERLTKTNFHLAPSLLKTLLDNDVKRKNSR